MSPEKTKATPKSSDEVQHPEDADPRAGGLPECAPRSCIGPSLFEGRRVWARSVLGPMESLQGPQKSFRS